MQACPIVSSEDHKPLRFGNTSQFLHSWLDLSNPRKDADGQHQVKGFILKGQGIDITHSHAQPLRDVSLHCTLACQFHH